MTAMQAPPSTRTLAGLILGPRSSVRRFVDRVRCAVEDVSACLSEGHHHDARHDAYLLNAERLALTTIQRMQREHSVYVPAVQAILQDVKSAQAANDAEGGCVYRTGWPIVRALAGALNRALGARRGTGR